MFEKLGVTGNVCLLGYFQFYALRLGWYANSVSLLQIPSVWASCSTVVFMSCSYFGALELVIDNVACSKNQPVSLSQ